MFGPQFARRIRARQGPRSDWWFLDEVAVSIRGQRRYLWRAVDPDGDILDILVQKRNRALAAKRFLRKQLKGQEQVPAEIATDKLGSYRATRREVMSSLRRCENRYANNQVEVAHEQTRTQETQRRGFRKESDTQRFLLVQDQRFVNKLDSTPAS